MALYCKESGYIEYKLVNTSQITYPIHSNQEQAIIIKFINVSTKGRGLGSNLLKDFFKANNDVKVFYLEAYFDNKHYKTKQDEKTGINRLIKFYKNHGFKTILPHSTSPYESVPMYLLTK